MPQSEAVVDAVDRSKKDIEECERCEMGTPDGSPTYTVTYEGDKRARVCIQCRGALTVGRTDPEAPV